MIEDDYPPSQKSPDNFVISQKVIILAKYLYIANVFSKELAKVLSQQIRVNEHAIKLEESKQPPYGLIYSLAPVEIKTFKTYIKTNLANGFITTFKSPADTLIFLFVSQMLASNCMSIITGSITL